MTTAAGYRPIALIVAGAFFMEQMDSTVIATALPQMGVSLGVDPLHMNLAMTCYLLALVVFIPASGSLADRFGTRNIFRLAIALFTLSSICCGMSTSLLELVAARVVQGASGAMMVPVGRLIMLRSVDKSRLVEAMSWVLTPAMLGPLLGPPIGGFITTYLSWHWVFFVNVPIGLAGLVLASIYIPQIRDDAPAPFDLLGLLLSGVSLSTLIYGLEVFSRGDASAIQVAALVGIGLLTGAAYARHARRQQRPVLDFSLTRIPTFHVALWAGTLVRTGFGALPFLLPLMLQVGLGFNPLESGLAMLASGAAALAMKANTTRIIRRFGYRSLLIWNGIICSLSLALCAIFAPGWPVIAIAMILLIGGFARSLQYNAFGTIAYADVAKPQMSSATSLYSTFLQLAATLGVAFAVSILHVSLRLFGHASLQPSDFSFAFVIVALLSATAIPLCMKLAPDAGAEISGHRRAGNTESSEAPAR
jgi:EmrB/QacA subfamily drug resistance transporter